MRRNPVMVPKASSLFVQSILGMGRLWEPELGCSPDFAWQ
ncbi:hypothetical protein EV13_1911 [Prochlorococcus sp. MIT 0702]|nr:hypothetical protein EV13_1911 [Prochlorococcus sp. MIT 0702]KGG28071.1 hypothetical protein EV12_0819 [Prochlorococcus sp. MIT 0701]KGG32848.1 hypothetical protein EV14_1991 [Prochlorococcus sp. MIT 0703]